MNMSSFNSIESTFTNLYVKNFGKEMTESKLCHLFSSYGIITSCKVNDINKNHLLLIDFINRFKQIIMVYLKDLVLLILKDQKWHKMSVDIHRLFSIIAFFCLLGNGEIKWMFIR